jgi:hypothetical protein
MIVAAALVLACGGYRKPVVEIISGRLKNLLTEPATTILHQSAPDEKWEGFILSGSTIQAARVCGGVSSRKSAISQRGIGIGV